MKKIIIIGLILLSMTLTSCGEIDDSSIFSNSTISSRTLSKISSESKLNVVVDNSLYITLNDYGPIIAGDIFRVGDDYYLPLKKIAFAIGFNYHTPKNEIIEFRTEDIGTHWEGKDYYTFNGRHSLFIVSDIIALSEKQGEETVKLTLHPAAPPRLNNPLWPILDYETKDHEYRLGDEVWIVWYESLIPALRTVEIGVALLRKNTIDNCEANYISKFIYFDENLVECNPILFNDEIYLSTEELERIFEDYIDIIILSDRIDVRTR